jgi:hypothetical protein
MQRGSRQSFKLIRILRTAETPLSTPEIVERMGRNPRNKTHTEAVKKLLQRAVSRGDIQRLAPGIYGYTPQPEVKHQPIQWYWGNDPNTPPGTKKLDFGIKIARLPTVEEDQAEGRTVAPVANATPGPAPPLPGSSYEEMLTMSEKQLDDVFYSLTGRHLFGTEQYEQLVDRMQEKQNGHRPRRLHNEP